MKQLFHVAKPKTTSLCVGNVITLEQIGKHDDSPFPSSDSSKLRKMAWTALQTLHHIINFNEIHGKENIFWDARKGLYRVGPNTIFDFDGKESSFTFPKGIWPPAGKIVSLFKKIFFLFFFSVTSNFFFGC